MADINDQLEPTGFPRMTAQEQKAARARLKADQKAFKAEQKNLRKERKSREKEFEDRQAEIMGEDSGGIGAFLITVMIILMWLVIMGLLVKLDVGGFGSTVLAPILKDVPYINRILPETSEDSSFSSNDDDEDEDGTMTAVGNPSNEYVRQLEGELGEAQQQNNASSEEIARLQAEVARLEPFEAQQQDLESMREQFYREVLYADNAPDTSNYAEYYEMIEPDKAAEIYADVLQEQIGLEEVQKYAATYSSMKPKKAAAILQTEAMDINLAARILNQMSSDDRGAILAAMTDTDYAARITTLLKPDALPYINGQAVDTARGSWSNSGATSINIQPSGNTSSASASTGATNASANASTGATDASANASTGATNAATNASTGATVSATNASTGASNAASGATNAGTGATNAASGAATNAANAFQSGRWSNSN